MPARPAPQRRSLSFAQRISESLSDIESRFDISILFACESGSRGWGFESAGAVPLLANSRIANTGFILGGRGFLLSAEEANSIVGKNSFAAKLLFPLRNGEDILNHCRNAWAIDAFGLGETDLRKQAPELWQQLRARVTGACLP